MDERQDAPTSPNDHLSDDEFLARYEACALHEFPHPDHLRMAFLYARRGGTSAAVEGARRLRAFATALGAPAKYHDTLTVGWARLVAHHAEADPDLGFRDLLAAHPRLLDRNLLSGHYSRELLASPAARREFVEPDLAPLP